MLNVSLAKRLVRIKCLDTFAVKYISLLTSTCDSLLPSTSESADDCTETHFLQ